MNDYLGEKVVSEKEYLSAMAMCCAVMRRVAGVQGTERGRIAVAECEMVVSSELLEAPGNRWTRRRKSIDHVCST